MDALTTHDPHLVAQAPFVHPVNTLAEQVLTLAGEAKAAQRKAPQGGVRGLRDSERRSRSRSVFSTPASKNSTGGCQSTLPRPDTRCATLPAICAELLLLWLGAAQ